MSASTSWVALVYHDVLPTTSASGGGPERFAVPSRMFERMLDVIASMGYRGCSLAEAMALPGEGRVAITFDDATISQFEHAVPALQARGMTATIYATTGWVGRPGYMTWDQLRDAAAQGMSIQSHTHNHPFLSELDAAGLLSELQRSKTQLDRELGQNTVEIAFPGGDAPRRALWGLLGEAGYKVVVGTRWGRNPDTLQPGPQGTIRRCTVRGDISEREAERFISGNAWLGVRRHARESVLRWMRRTMGPSRYARWRRRVLDVVSRS